MRNRPQWYDVSYSFAQLKSYKSNSSVTVCQKEAIPKHGLENVTVKTKYSYFVCK